LQEWIGAIVSLSAGSGKFRLQVSRADRHNVETAKRPGPRRKRSGMHHIYYLDIYYLASRDSVEVLNMIHAQRDPGQHLKLERWEGEE
jgi:hypothetical protein